MARTGLIWTFLNGTFCSNITRTPLTELLTFWTENATKPTVLFLDEVDALIGDTLISLLRQIRSGYNKRPTSFPISIILCGVRDVRDYRIHSSKTKEIITGGSAFNIKAESLRLENFSKEHIENLYRQHTHTGAILNRAKFFKIQTAVIQ